MITVSSYPIAVAMCVITMICWGSWGNTQKLASKSWKFQLFYWDYTIGILLFSLLLAFTAGSFGEGGRSFVDDLSQADSQWLLSALIGGAVFNLSNILLVIAIDIAGLAVAFPVGIGLALVLGVITTYAARPRRRPHNARRGSCVHLRGDCPRRSRIPQARRGRFYRKGHFRVGVGGRADGLLLQLRGGVDGKIDMSTGVAVLESGRLSPYTAMVVFALGIFVSNFVFNTLAMKFPVGGGKSVSYAQYFTDGNAKLHLVGILGGSIWCLGTSFSFISANAAGAALAYGLGQGATMVSALWGVFVWREFRGAPKGTNKLLALMFACFVVGAFDSRVLESGIEKRSRFRKTFA